MKQVYIGAVSVLLLAQLGLNWGMHHFWAIAVLLQFFFIAFNLLEATLPSLISKIAPAQSKGTAMGVYTSSQFIGAFVGGAAGGWLHGKFGKWDGVSVLCRNDWFVVAGGAKHAPTALFECRNAARDARRQRCGR
jgi:MFS family permease